MMVNWTFLRGRALGLAPGGGQVYPRGTRGRHKTRPCRMPRLWQATASAQKKKKENQADYSSKHAVEVQGSSVSSDPHWVHSHGSLAMGLLLLTARTTQPTKERAPPSTTAAEEGDYRTIPQMTRQHRSSHRSGQGRQRAGYCCCGRARRYCSGGCFGSETTRAYCSGCQSSRESPLGARATAAALALGSMYLVRRTFASAVSARLQSGPLWSPF